MAILDYLPELYRGLRLAFAINLLHDFSIKLFFIWYWIYGQGFNVIPFVRLKDIKQNVLLSSYLDNWWRHEL